MPNSYDVCPLDRMPAVENIDICGDADDRVRPEWEQSAASRILGVEPVVIAGAGHANLVHKGRVRSSAFRRLHQGL